MFKNVSMFPKLKCLIHVPYADKEDAKAHGAYFDADLKSWYIPYGDENKNYSYLKSKYGTKLPKNEKIYLNVSYENKDDAKVHRAFFDAEEKMWYTWSNNEHKDYLVQNYLRVPSDRDGGNALHGHE